MQSSRQLWQRHFTRTTAIIPSIEQERLFAAKSPAKTAPHLGVWTCKGDRRKREALIARDAGTGCRNRQGTDAVQQCMESVLWSSLFHAANTCCPRSKASGVPALTMQDPCVSSPKAKATLK